MHLVRIRLRKPRRVFSFLCNENLILGRGEPCIVQTDRGQEWGACLLPPEPCPPDLESRFSMRVLRIANEDDHKTVGMLDREEVNARGICAKKIEKHGLPMKLVDVEYTFDKRKIIFYFTAEDRVDFRELVRDLAHDLRTRIELRHIQVRDEAKMVGGIGGCGRELCCSTWLNEFKPISMRMAKRQDLSLNPSKISGQCGRLLCCLSYENDQYEPIRKKKKRRAEESAQAGADQEGPAESPREDAGHARKERPPRTGDGESAPEAAPRNEAPEAGDQGDNAPQPRDDGGAGDEKRGRGRPRRRGGRRRKRGGESGGGDGD